MAQSMPHGAMSVVLNGFFTAIEVNWLWLLKKLGKSVATTCQSPDYFHDAHAFFFYPSSLNYLDPCEL
jgi:hypothetical protein